MASPQDGTMSDVPPDPLPARYHDLFSFRLLEWCEGSARLAAEAGPQHMNRAGVVHGGFVLGLIDQAAAYSGLWCSVPGHARRGMTLALATQFVAPVAAGRVVAESRMVGHGGTTFFTRIEVFRADGTLVATGQGTHRWRSGSERIEGMPVAQMTGAGGSTV
jgi:uncharacterized protein (TIGR00369 family)